MMQFIYAWDDLIALVSAVLLSVFLTRKYYRQPGRRFRSVALFFMVFGPVVIATHMFLHTAEISYQAIENSSKGNFTYTFRFYSLLLMGGVIGGLSLRFLNEVSAYFIYGSVTRSSWLKTAGLISLAAAPTIPFTFIGSLPVLACGLTLLASLFVRRKRQRQAVVATLKPGEAVAF